MEQIKKFKQWDIFEKMPNGWKEDKTCGSPLCGYTFITNGKSVLNGGKRALLKKIELNKTKTKKVSESIENLVVEIKKNTDTNYVFPAKQFNLLARKKFQEQLLKEIIFDLKICEIEGWDKLEYLFELKSLIDHFIKNIKQKKSNCSNYSNTLFDI